MKHKQKEPTHKLKIKDVEIGQHFWAIALPLGDQTDLMVCIKTQDGIYAAGDWECPIPESDLQVLQIIPCPVGLENSKIMFNR